MANWGVGGRGLRMGGQEKGEGHSDLSMGGHQGNGWSNYRFRRDWAECGEEMQFLRMGSRETGGVNAG